MTDENGYQCLCSCTVVLWELGHCRSALSGQNDDLKLHLRYLPVNSWLLHVSACTLALFTSTASLERAG